jgi:hypothetical protein
LTQTGRCRVVDAGSEPADGAFLSAHQLAQLVADWPLRELVEVWNKLPGVRCLSRFENRAVAVQRIWRALNPAAARTKRASEKRRQRRTTKTQTVLRMLRQPEGTTLRALMKATGWQAHSVRGFLSRKVSRELRLPVASVRRDGKRVYCLSAPVSQPE